MRVLSPLLAAFLLLVGSGVNDDGRFRWGARNCAACGIAGYDSGQCEDAFDHDMDFCQGLVNYRACVPISNTQFPNHTTRGKDLWIENMYNTIIEERIAVEENSFYIDNQVNEYGDPGVLVPRFSDPNVRARRPCMMVCGGVIDQ